MTPKLVEVVAHTNRSPLHLVLQANSRSRKAKALDWKRERGEEGWQILHVNGARANLKVPISRLHVLERTAAEA